MIIMMIFFIITLEPWACPFLKSLYGIVSPISSLVTVWLLALPWPSWEEVIKKAAAAQQCLSQAFPPISACYLSGSLTTQPTPPNPEPVLSGRLSCWVCGIKVTDSCLILANCPCLFLTSFIGLRNLQSHSFFP